MTPMIIWFCLALVVTFVEMFLLTFYLLAVGAGMSAGGIAAYLDCTLETQITAAGITTIIVACLSFILRKKLRGHMDSKVTNMDQGERVHIEASKIAADGTAKVVYRGADWMAYSTKGPLTAGIYLIDKIDGTRLVLEEKVGDESQVQSATSGQININQVPSAEPENKEVRPEESANSSINSTMGADAENAASKVEITKDPDAKQNGDSSAKF